MSISQTIDPKKLARLASGLITYELAEHNVDPRVTLEGTTLRLEAKEGYKYGVYKRSQKRLSNGGPYVDVVQKAISDGNLVSFYQKGYLNDLISEKGPEDLEVALKLLYEGDDDQKAFELITNYIGGRFDIVGLIFFIKDCEKYLPIRSSIFDNKFKVLGIDAELEGHCNWDKYQEYIGWIKEIQQFLVRHINKNITLLDAHSFVWIVDGIEDYINEGVQLVEHKKFGNGKIVGYEDDYVFVKFGKDVRQFDKKSAFKDGFLKLIKSDYDIYKDDDLTQVKSITLYSRDKKSYIVFQGGQYDKEYASGYLWAPYYDKRGNTPHHWARMKELRCGDTVFHYSAGHIRAVSTVTKEWVDSDRPKVLSQDESWKLKGMKVECDPIILDDPIDVYMYTDAILKYRKVKYSGFNINGAANEGYLYELEPELAELFNKAAGISKTKQLTSLREKEIYIDPELVKLNNEEDEQLVNDLRQTELSDANDNFQYIEGRKDKAEPKITGEHKSYPRDKQTAINALAHACYKCEIDPTHPTFIRKGSDKPYTEPHHLVPMAFSDQFNVSLDREQNIVSLCSNCHNEIHYGRDARVLIEKLYEDRKELLKSVGIVISLDELLKMYGITE